PLKFRGGPIRCLLITGRPGQPRSVRLRDLVQMVHHLRVVESLRFDPVDDPQVNPFLGQTRKAEQEKARRGRHPCNARHPRYTTPLSASVATSPSLPHVHTTAPRRAPGHTRTPISLALCVTAYDMTP